MDGTALTAGKHCGGKMESAVNHPLRSTVDMMADYINLPTFKRNSKCILNFSLLRLIPCPTAGFPRLMLRHAGEVTGM